MPKGIFKRKPHTEETKLKMSLAKLGKVCTKKHKKNISKALMGNKLSVGNKSKTGYRGLIEYKNWNSLGYTAKHYRIYIKYGRAKKCEALNCLKRSKKYHWANISGKYLQDKSDWVMLCAVCHKNIDMNRNNKDKINVVIDGVIL